MRTSRQMLSLVQRSTTFSVVLLAMLWSATNAPAFEPQPGAAEPLRVLLLGGSSGSHQPRPMVEQFLPATKPAAIELTYSEETNSALTDDSLAQFDVLAIFKDEGELSAEAERSLLRFIESGHGLVAIHSASHAFRNSHAYTRLVGGRFLRHGHESFRPTIIDAQHPAMSCLKSFDTRDETYVHNELSDDIRVLMVRAEQGGYEPYTWVRQQGKGRVYYTALGHDEATWRQPDFHRQLIQALRWAGGRLEPADPQDATTESVSVADYTRRALENGPPEPLSPAESVKRMHLPEGFRVELFAAEPDIVKPISMTFDARGRAWIIESVDYPNDVLPPFEGHDRIKICEDSDGDGRADRFKVFAKGLNIPTSLLPYRDGVLVALAPHIVFLRDTDGDDVCDQREILFTGFGRFDTHAVHSNLRWGFDNWVWGTVGYSGGEFDVAGKHHRFKQGVFRFRPDGSEFEFLTSTSNNTWGLGFRETGEPFVSTANNQHAVQLAIPNRYYEQVRGWHGQGSAGIEDHKRFHALGHDVRQVDWHGEYTAAAGQTVYTARQFPAEYADRATFVCEPTGHLVHIDWLVPQGSAYAARDGWNLMASDDPWCAPIETHVGPDGAVWMLDWYNYIVRHNPTPPGFETGVGNAYITSQRDKSHGRIYRIVSDANEKKDAPSPASPRSLHAATLDEHFDALASDNLWWRLTAQRLLVERTDANSSAALLTRLQDPSTPERSLPHLLWVSRQDSSLLKDPHWIERTIGLLRHPAVAVRRAALEVLPRDEASTKAIVSSGCLEDAEPVVRLAALLALAESPGSTAAAQAIARLYGDPKVTADRWLPQATIAAAAPSAIDFLHQLAAIQVNDNNRAALTTAASAIAEHWARGQVHLELASLINDLGATDPQLAAAVLNGLAVGWPADNKLALDPAARPNLERLFARLPAEGQLQLVELSNRWQAGETLAARLKEIEQALLSQVANAQLDDAARTRAAGQLAGLAGRAEILSQLMAVVTPQASPALSQGILDALSQSKSAETAKLVLDAWQRLTPGVRRQAIALLLRRPVWTNELLAAIDSNHVGKDELALDQVQQLINHPDKKLAARARKSLAGGSMPSSNRAELLRAMLPLASQSGDPQVGRKVFEQNCAKCHRHGALGEAIGPDLTGIAARRREEILADVLDPNRSVEGNYRQYTLSTTGGEIFTGLLLAETQAGYELLDSQAKKHFVLRGDVDEFQASPLSVMPEGFEKLPTHELTGLIEFLAARGKYLPLSLAKGATIVSTQGMFNDRASSVERLIASPWGPKEVSGVPFQLLDPRGEQVPNVILLEGPPGQVSRTMPKSASVACGLAAGKIHLLSGVSGWGFPIGTKGSVSMIVRLHYAGGETEDHSLLNGVHFADYIRRVDVPGSDFAFALRDQQMRYLAIIPQKTTEIDSIEFIKGSDQSSPVVMAVTIERLGE